MLSYKTHMLCDIAQVMLSYLTHVMFCYITHDYVMLYNTCHNT